MRLLLLLRTEVYACSLALFFVVVFFLTGHDLMTKEQGDDMGNVLFSRLESLFYSTSQALSSFNVGTVRRGGGGGGQGEGVCVWRGGG